MPSASDIKAGGAFWELYTKNGPLYAGLQAAQRRIRAFSTSAMGIGFSIASSMAAVAAPLTIGIKAASDMEETMNKFNVVFGDNAARVKDWGDAYAGEVGRSKQQIADFLGSNQDLFVPMGFDSASAEEISKTLTKLSIDLASFNNTADADAFRDLQAAMTGSGEVMKKYGVILSQAAVNQELANQGMDPKTATEMQKAQARLAIIMRGTTAAQGDAIRSSGGFANQMKALKAAAWDAAGALGSAILPAVTDVLTGFVTVAKATGEWIANNAGLVRIFAAVVAGGMAVAAALIAFGGAGLVLSGIVSGLATVVSVVGTVLGVVGSVLGFLISPIGLVIAGLAGLAAYFAYTSGAAGAAADWIMERFGQLMGFIKEVYGGIADAMAAGDMQLAAEVLWAGIRVAWEGGLAWIRQQWAELRFFLVELWAQAAFGILDTLNELWAGMVDGFWDVAGVIVDAWKWAEKTLAEGIGWIIAKLQGLDPGDVVANLQEDYARQQQGRDDKRETRRTELADATKNRRQAIEAAHQEWTAGAAAKRTEALDNAGKNYDEAKRRFAEARQAAATARETAEKTTKSDSGPKTPEAPGTDFAAAKATVDQGGLSKSADLFSAEAYKLMAESRGQEQAQRTREKQLGILARIERNTKADKSPALKEAVPPAV